MTRLKQFVAGVILATVGFIIYNRLVNDVFLHWQELVLSLVYGGYTVLTHRLMKFGQVAKCIVAVLLVIQVVCLLLWYAFCYAMRGFTF